jgi:hypothetical protein
MNLIIFVTLKDSLQSTAVHFEKGTSDWLTFEQVKRHDDESVARR